MLVLYYFIKLITFKNKTLDRYKNIFNFFRILKYNYKCFHRQLLSSTTFE